MEALAGQRDLIFFMNFANHINFIYVLLGTALFGMSAGVLGCFALLRKRALVGDALAHAALPGVCIAYLLTGAKHPLIFVCGAAVSGLLGSYAIHAITRYSRIKEDAAIGLVLSVFFGIGIVLLTYIQHQPMGNQSGLDKFLFGQAAALIGRDLALFSGLAAALLVAVCLAYKEFKLIAFDSGFAQVIGVPVRAMEVLLTLLIVLVVTAGLQAVGVVLMAAMLITPAAAARQWTDSLAKMLLLAGAFGALSGVLGTVASALAPRMPTGPWIVVAVSTFFAISIVLAPLRGMLPRWLKQRRNAEKIQQENVLKTLYRLGEDDISKQVSGSSVTELRRYRHSTERRAQQLLERLRERGLVVPGQHTDLWKLTAEGERAARGLVRRHRLWEVYLTTYLALGQGEVHADAEDIEHVLTPELEAELEALLGRPTHDPHQRPIPYGEGALT